MLCEVSQPVLSPHPPTEAPPQHLLSTSEPPENSSNASGSKDPCVKEEDDAGVHRSGLQDSTCASIHQEEEVDWADQVPQEDGEVFSQLCKMLRDDYFQREHQMLMSFTPERQAIWKSVRKIEDDFDAKAQDIKEEALRAIRKSGWRSHHAHLRNPRQRGLHHDRFRARN